MGDSELDLLELDEAGVGSRSLGVERRAELSRNPSDLSGDYGAITLLLLLYTLQGIPLGLSQSMSYLLQAKKLGYADQGIFDSVSWPYSLKLLWAPIVDACFFASFGRRKTWLVPVQLLLGVLLLTCSGYANGVLDSIDGGREDTLAHVPQIWPLTYLFFGFYALAATQDVAVDGWALTILSRRNVGLASTCNAAGQQFGFFVAFVGFLQLQTYGLATLGGFMRFWGVVFVVTTLGIALLKREAPPPQEGGGGGGGGEDEDELVGIGDAYRRMWLVLKTRGVQAIVVVLFTRAVAFAPTDNLATRKLIEKGVRKEDLAGVLAIVTPIAILLPPVISRYTASKPMSSVFLRMYGPRLLVGVLTCAVVYLCPSVDDNDYAEGGRGMPRWYLVLITAVTLMHAVVSTAQFVALMAFFAKISDPAIGGTYMTMLNTVANLGSKWPNQLVLFLTEATTVTHCTAEGLGTCGTSELLELCKKEGGGCVTDVDGYYVLSALCTVVGVAWLWWFGPRLRALEAADVSTWRTSAKGN